MAAPLPPLATTDDLVARLGRPLTSVEANRAEALLRDASVIIRNHCSSKDFLWHPGDVQRLRMVDSEIKLPGRPITAVASVVAIGSPSMGLPNVPLPWFHFDGIDTVRVDPGSNGIINLPEAWWEYSDLYVTADVTYDHGFQDGFPDDVVGVCAWGVIGTLTAPSMAAGLIGESIGPYSYRLERTGGGMQVALSQADLKTLDKYRDRQGTSTVRLR